MLCPTPQPAGLRAHLFLNNVEQGSEFYVKAFGAQVVLALGPPHGPMVHAQLLFAGHELWLSLAQPESGHTQPSGQAPSSCRISFYSADVDAVLNDARQQGATIERKPTDEFFGDRVAYLCDPFGHRWAVHTRREHLDHSTIRQRFEQMLNANTIKHKAPG